MCSTERALAEIHYTRNTKLGERSHSAEQSSGVYSTFMAFLCLECCSNKVVLFLKLLFWVSYLHDYFLPMVCDAVGYQYGHIQNVIGNLKNYG